MELSPGAKHYLVTALWSTIDYEIGLRSGDDYNLDDRFSVEDISQEFKEQAQKDFDKLLALCSKENLFGNEELTKDDLEQIGHDFWLTRNGHGAGFWDGDYVNGDAITKIVKDNFTENDDELRESIVR